MTNLIIAMQPSADAPALDDSLAEINARFDLLRKFSTNTKTTVFLAKVRCGRACLSRVR
jgi:hypothetical protein